MTDLLEVWVNSLELSEDVSNLDDDMRNGFLLGELLFRHNQLHTFGKFLRTNNSDAKINNWCLIEPALRAMNIKFDAQMANSIMQGKPGAASTVLYKVKMYLDRLINYTTPVSSYDKPEGVKALTNMPMRTSKPQYERTSQLIFEAAIRQLVENQNDILVTDHLRRFEDEAERQQRRVQLSKERTTSELEQQKDQIRSQRIVQRQQERRFMESWEHRGLETWMENQERAKKRVAVRKNVIRKQQQTRAVRSENARQQNELQVTESIRDFEARLELMNQSSLSAPAAPQSGDDELEAALATSSVLDRRQREKEMQGQVTAMRQQKFESDRQCLAREKRRRRFITEREEAQVSEYHQRAAEHLEDQLVRKSIKERTVEASLELISRHRAMMVENRGFRQTQYKTRAEIDVEEALKRDNAHMEQARTFYEEELAAQVVRYSTSLEARSSAQRTRNEELCHETLLRVVDLALEVVAFRRFARPAVPPSDMDLDATEKDMVLLLPSLPWADMKRVFVAGLPLLALDGAGASEAPVAWGETSTLKLKLEPETEPEAAVAVPQLVDDVDLADYIGNQYPWASADVAEAHAAAKAKAPAMPAPAEEATNVLDYSAPVHALGELVVEARLAAFPLAAPEPPPDVPKFPLRICLCGRSFSGKSEQAWRLADRYALKVLSAEALLSEAIEKAAGIQYGRITQQQFERGTWSSKELTRLGQKALSKLNRGGEVDDDVYAGLVIAGIHRIKEANDLLAERQADPDASVDSQHIASQGWVVEDFPGTAAQAALFEKLLSGYDGAAHVATRWDRASELAEPRAKPPRDTSKLVPSGIDLVLYVDADQDAVLRRNLGRRTDPETDTAYHLDTNRPPYDVVCKERLLVPTNPSNPSFHLSFQVAAHDVAADELKEFFAQFGTLHLVNSNNLTAEGLFAAVNSIVHHQIDKRVQDETSAAAADAAAADAAAAAADEPLVLPPPAAKLSEPLAVVLARMWDTAETHFRDGACKVFRALREERALVSIHLMDVRVQFDDFLRRPDDKQPKLSAFLQAFNSLPEDMRFDDKTKAELHLRSEELRHDLWLETEEREAAARARLVAIRGDGWLDQRVTSLERNFSFLIQLEMDRFNTSLNMLLDYNSALTGDAPEGMLDELAVEGGGDEAAGDKKGGKKGGKDDKKAKKGAAGPADGTPGRSALPVDVLSSVLGGGDLKEKGGKKADKKKDKKDKKGKGDGRETPGSDAGGGDDNITAVAAEATAALAQWLPEAFLPAAAEDGADSGPSGLHEAVWVQAALATSRIGRLAAKGGGARMLLRSDVGVVYDELDQWIGTRIGEELSVCERVIELSQQAVEDQVALTSDWVIDDGVTLTINPSRVLLEPPPPPPTPVVVPLDARALNSVQLEGLHASLQSASAAEMGYAATADEAALSVGSLSGLLMRAAAADTELPDEWCAQADTQFARVCELLDPDDTGFVLVSRAMSFFADSGASSGWEWLW